MRTEAASRRLRRRRLRARFAPPVQTWDIEREYDACWTYIEVHEANSIEEQMPMMVAGESATVRWIISSRRDRPDPLSPLSHSILNPARHALASGCFTFELAADMQMARAALRVGKAWLSIKELELLMMLANARTPATKCR